MSVPSLFIATVRGKADTLICLPEGADHYRSFVYVNGMVSHPSDVVTDVRSLLVREQGDTPAGLVVMADGSLLNWIGENFVRQSDYLDAIEELAEALRLTVEYVGTDMLRPVGGWSWYDALLKYRPEVAKRFYQEAREIVESPSDRDDERASLMNGLVGEHHSRYHTDPQFRAVITTIANLIPTIVDVLAQQSDRQDAQIILARANRSRSYLTFDAKPPEADDGA